MNWGTPENPRMLVRAELLARVLMLLNEKPRFGPRDRRLRFDSYSLASDIEALFHAQSIDPLKVIAALPRE